jgi:hypothetical protein
MGANLHWLVVHKQTVQSSESFVSTIGAAEGNVGDATANTIRSIGYLNLPNRSN